MSQESTQRRKVAEDAEENRLPGYVQVSMLNTQQNLRALCASAPLR